MRSKTEILVMAVGLAGLIVAGYLIVNDILKPRPFYKKQQKEVLFRDSVTKETVDFSRSAIPVQDDYPKQDEVPFLLSWKLLADIQYTSKESPGYPGGVLWPTVNYRVRQLKGKEVELTGFVVPIDTDMYALSQNVTAACFFCGAAGPESVSGLKFKGKTPRLDTDQRITVRGNFRYNETDPDDWIYHIDNVVIVAGK